ncbi:hypothetical protein BCY84_18964 [Trypanosoma cruzi cruzi]|uniref:DoxX n=1 Tax=Trypanosoma cruzi TaxID=5693 RepID=A0A2V2VWU2_TRYCR|nr:hypothetical protein TcBrA4_0123320 [Trypanosoma cruzi]PBJ69952.1 hypothetical protein BCY84_18964 [Trypanosoma cruzi cruzi]PWV00287.1 hypothetical protein C4B63_7g103 [Trypanosoma cruzi]
MTLRSAIRYIGLVQILLIFIASGFQQISNPAVSAALLAKSNFPKMLKMAGVGYRLSASEYTTLIQASGALFLGFSLFILLGVGRCFFAFMLALSTVLVTIAFHVDPENPAKTSNTDFFHVLKNISIVGALLFVAGSGQRTHRFSRAHQEAETEKKNR